MHNKLVAEIEQAKRDKEDVRAKEAEDLKKTHGDSAHCNTLFPEYEWDNKFMVNREVNKPPAALFYACGWDRDDIILKNPDPNAALPDEVNAEPEKENLLQKDGDKEDGEKEDVCESAESGIEILRVKHYRRFYNDELENVTDVLPIPSPFNQYDMKKG